MTNQPIHVCVKTERRFHEKFIETQPEIGDRLGGPDRCGDSGSSFSSNHKSVLEHADASRVGEIGYSSPGDPLPVGILVLVFNVGKGFQDEADHLVSW